MSYRVAIGYLIGIAISGANRVRANPPARTHTQVPNSFLSSGVVEQSFIVKAVTARARQR